MRTAQIRLLYKNSDTGIAVTVIAAPVLSYFLWEQIPHQIVIAWLVWMLVIAIGRFILARRYWRASPDRSGSTRWGAAFAVGAGLAGIGWGGAAVVLYPEYDLMNQVFLLFVLGGMMLGGASLLASRRDAFVAFLVPAGLLPVVRLISQGDKEHIAMALLAALFTAATLLTTYRYYSAIRSSLNLQFENDDLVGDLQAANRETEALNQQLEKRVEERTAELHESAVRLRAEIAQRERMEDELLRVRNLESLGLLAGGIAHDFNNFLTVVQGNIELARMHLEGDAAVQQILEQTMTACQRAAFLASQLLTFAKGGAPVRRVVSTARLIQDAVQLARAGAPVSIDVDLPENLWSAEVDEGQIGQVLHNILLNAKQAMPEGGIIEVRAENVVPEGGPESGSGTNVRISVHDYGHGIPHEILPRIFDPYFTTRRGGSGLGLTTAYAIVTKHGGHISVDSKPGDGAVFTIDLPATKAPPAPAECAAPAELQSGTGRLLVMDDEEALRTLLKSLLTSLGYEVQTARDGAEAIALYETAKVSGFGFDAVLLDLTVTGGMGGIEAAGKLRELDPSVKLLVSSGYSDAPVMSNFRTYGFAEAIPKPWRAAQISEAFAKVLASNEQKQTN